MDEWGDFEEDELENLTKVLVIDDEKFIIMLIEEMISSMDGYISKGYSISKDGLDFAQNHEVDIILIDNLMPGILGSDFILKIRNSDGPNKDVPFLIISANPEMAEDKLEGVENIGYLVKPIQMANFMETLTAATS